jgi:hypothetical protein
MGDVRSKIGKKLKMAPIVNGGSCSLDRVFSRIFLRAGMESLKTNKFLMKLKKKPSFCLFEGAEYPLAETLPD